MSCAWISVLFRVNLFLQVWDGGATYYGLAQGVREGNPLLQFCVDCWGVGVAVVSAKAATCGLLWFLYQVADLPLSQWGLLLTALSYVLLSVLPWCVVLFLS
jgi:Domain of unknown function (DUF5658)